MSHSDKVIIRDIDGKHVVVTTDEMNSYFNRHAVSFLGLSYEEILEFLAQYQTYGGKKPITVESIQELFKILRR